MHEPAGRLFASESGAGGEPVVCACVCTYGRPEMLGRCLASLADQQVRGLRVQFIIVDNNPEPKARLAVEEFAARCPYPAVYEHEPEQGIPLARNRALEAALRLEADWIAFMDDDEIAAEDWLQQLHDAAQLHGADVVHGRVIRKLPSPMPFWAIEEDKPRGEGQAMPTCATNNVIFRTWLIRPGPGGAGLRFDETLRFTGGSDTDFFQSAQEAGARIVWSNLPVVTEEVPARRLTYRWQVMRGYRVGANKAMREVKRHGVRYAARKFAANIVLSYLRGSAQLIAAVILAPVDLRRFKYLARQGGRAICSASGNIAGLLSIRPEPYRTIDGS